MCSKLVPAKAGNALMPGDSTKRRADFSKERSPVHLSYQIASPATGFRCNTMQNIPWQAKSSPPILPSRKRKFLSNNLLGGGGAADLLSL